MGIFDYSVASLSRWLVMGVAAAVTAAVTAAAGTRVYEIAQGAPCGDCWLAALVPGTRCPIEHFVVVTDKGNRLPLYAWSAAAPEFGRFATASEQQYMRDFPSIRREPASDQTNCHGWVFTQGRHLLFGTEVEQILRDNGYWVADRPNANDVIIYRNRHGVIVHSGIVRAVFADGTVMIESKWGISARFLHLPTDQPYGDKYQYYRTDSATHDVCVMSRDTQHTVLTCPP
jgi:hypothetical protein